MKNGMKILNILLLSKKMNQMELSCLLASLIRCYVDKKESDLMSFLLNDQFVEFQALCRHMNDEGAKIKKSLVENENHP